MIRKYVVMFVLVKNAIYEFVNLSTNHFKKRLGSINAPYVPYKPYVPYVPLPYFPQLTNTFMP